MTRLFCDVCGKEITNTSEVWKHTLLSKPGHRRTSYNKTIEDMCEECAVTLDVCLTMLKNGVKPNYDQASKKEENTYSDGK